MFIGLLELVPGRVELSKGKTPTAKPLRQSFKEYAENAKLQSDHYLSPGGEPVPQVMLVHQLQHKAGIYRVEAGFRAILEADLDHVREAEADRLRCERIERLSQDLGNARSVADIACVSDNTVQDQLLRDLADREDRAGSWAEYGRDYWSRNH